MNRKRYVGIVLGALALLLVAANVTIWQRENLLRNGQVVLLELAPVEQLEVHLGLLQL